MSTNNGVPIRPFGWEFPSELAAADVDPAMLHDRLSEQGLVVFRNQSLSDSGMVNLLHRLGEPTFTQGENRVQESPQLNRVSNVGKANPKSVFHSDTSYVRQTPAYTMLRPIELPSRGGATLFTNQYTAWRRLPRSIRESLLDVEALHVVTGLDPSKLSETQAWHPLAKPHPRTGRLALFLTTPKRCVDLRDRHGKTIANASRMLRLLYRHSINRCSVHRHDWQFGDLVIWDNRCTMHRGDHDGVIGHRVFHRGMVLDTEQPSSRTASRSLLYEQSNAQG